MKHLYHLLTFAILMPAVFSCSKEAGQVTSRESIALGRDSLLLSNEAQTGITLELMTEYDWELDSVLPATDLGNVDWITVYDQEGSDNATVTLSCKQNEDTADRLAFVRFKIKGAYPEYRTCKVIQSGTPSVSTKAIADASAESITLSGSYVYTGEYVTRTGFEVWKNGNDAEKSIVYAEGTDSDFSLVYPIEYGNDYRYRAFVEGFAGKIFLAGNDASISIRFSIGAPKIEGELRTNTATKEVYIVLPYYFGDGKSYMVSASCDIEGLSIETKEVSFESNGGEIRLKITGTPANTGTATFTLTGLPGESESVSVSAEIQEGGVGLVLYLETFGPTPLPSDAKAFNLIGYPTAAGIVSDDIVNFNRYGQPQAEYIRGTDRTNIRHEPIMHPKPENYAWASGSPVLHTGKNFQGILTINNLNIEGATNIKLDFGYISYLATFPKEIIIEYSNDGGQTWTQVDWQLTKPYQSGGASGHSYILAETTGEIIGSDNFCLRLTLNSNAGDSRIDDLRLTGDRL